MAKIKTGVQVEIRKTSVCPAGTKVLGMLPDATATSTGEPIKIKTIIGKSKLNGRYACYIDEEKREHLYGLIQTKLDDDWVANLIEDGNYEIQLVSHNGNLMNGTLNELVQEGTSTDKVDTELDEEIKRLCEDIVNSGIATKEEMEERMKVFKENRVDSFLITRILSRYRKYNKPAHKPSCVYQDPYSTRKKKKQESIISEGLRAAASRTAIIAEGEKSVGKNVYLETIAWLMGMPLYLITFSRQMSPASIYGEKTTDPSAAKALAAFDERTFVAADEIEEKRKLILNACSRTGMKAEDALQVADMSLTNEDRRILAEVARFKKLQAQSASVNIVIDQSELYDWLTDGGLLVFNEMNMADANFLASFANQLLDGTGFLFIPGRGEVKIHEDCVLFATQNAEYQGVEMQNEATMSRFGCIVFPQPESIKKQVVAATEAAIKKGDSPSAKLDDKYYQEAQNFYAQCSKSVKSGAVSNACLNIRGFVRALTTVAESNGYASLKRQIEIQVINTCPVDDRMALGAALEQIVTL